MGALIDSAVKFLQTKLERLNAGNSKSSEKKDVELNYEERKLFENLRARWMELAQAENIPPHMIAHDSVLKNIAKTKPGTKEEMLLIEGIGERQFDKYSVYFLKIIRSTISSE